MTFSETHFALPTAVAARCTVVAVYRKEGLTVLPGNENLRGLDVVSEAWVWCNPFCLPSVVMNVLQDSDVLERATGCALLSIPILIASSNLGFLHDFSLGRLPNIKYQTECGAKGHGEAGACFFDSVVRDGCQPGTDQGQIACCCVLFSVV